MPLPSNALRHRWGIILLAGFMLACVMFGGSSRPDNVSMLIVRPLSVLYIVVALLLPQPRHWQGLNAPVILLAALAAVIAVQLVPLPPEIWTKLPGHQPFSQAATVAGLPQPWRPISLMPDMTLNSLLALLVPLAVLVGAATVPPDQRRHLVPILLFAILLSAVLGIVQWAGGPSSPLYFYRYTSRDLPVGFLANRNHQAVLLAMGLPLLRLWVVLPSELVRRQGTRNWLAVAAAMLLLLVIVATGSRSGFLLALVGIVAALVIAPPHWRALIERARLSRRQMTIAGIVAAGAVAVATFVLMSGRAVSITRLSEIDQVEADLRIRFFPIVVQMTRDFLPFGSGFGTFEELFHLYEPHWALKRTNYNHAHNDLVELALTGGVAAVLVLLACAGFAVLRVRAIIRFGRRRSSAMLASGGLAVILLAFLASLTDYPLRTPAMAMVFALAAVWFANPLKPRRCGG